VIQSTDSKHFASDDEWRSGSTGLLLRSNEEVWGIAWNDQANDEDYSNIEDKDTEEGPLDGPRDILAGIFGFADSHTNKLGSNVGKERINCKRTSES
jgi:hypothetical protein